MNGINPFLGNLLNQVTLCNERVINVLVNAGANTDEILRLMSYMSCASDFPEVNPTKVLKNGTVATLESYNVFSNKVCYTYPTMCKRYFKTQEDADNAVATGNTSGWSYQDDRWPYMAEIPSTNRDYMSLDEWNN